MARMLITRLRLVARSARGPFSRASLPQLCPRQDPIASASERPPASSAEQSRSFSATAPLFVKAGGKLDVSAVAAALEEANGVASIRREDLVVNRTTTPKPKPALSELLFGRVCTDHMLQASWSAGAGWNAPSIDPLAPLQLHPAAQVLHYGIECFEGMKAYMGVDGRIRMFRPDQNMDRLARSAQRLNLPDFDKAEYLECIKELLRVERDWLPDKEGFSLYLRPTYIATTPTLGIAPPAAALLYTIISPVGPYFPTGVKPIKLFVDSRHARAWPGGVGDCKVGGNYASTIRPQVQAAALGCQQVLYVLDSGAEGDGIVGESGAMNVFFLWRRKDGTKELVTPPLDGMILPGVTRDTVLSLVRSWSEFEVAERPIRWREIEAAVAENRMLEMFGTGTAVIIQPISTLLKSDGTALTVPFDAVETSRWIDRRPGTTYGAREEPTTSLAGRLMRTIMDVQYGHTDSPWSMPIS